MRAPPRAAVVIHRTTPPAAARCAVCALVHAQPREPVQVTGGYAQYTFKLGAGECYEQVCIYAKDGSFEHAPGSGEGDVPSCAYTEVSQKCQICELKIDVRFSSVCRACRAQSVRLLVC